MPRPADSALFATDATYTMDGDAWEGDPTRVDPGPGRLAEGFEPDTLPAEWLNYQLGLLGDWTDYFASVIDEDDEHTYPTPKTRIYLPALDVQGALAAGAWYQSPTGIWATSQTSESLIALFRLPRGSTLTQCRVFVGQGTAQTGTSRMSATLRRHSVAVFPTSAPTSTVIGAQTYASGSVATDAGRDDIVWSGLSEAVNPATMWYSVEVTPSAGAGGTADVFYCVELSLTDVGPRAA